MGKISEALDELEPKLSKVLEYVKEIDTVVLHDKLNKDVYKSFAALKPLSYKQKTIPDKRSTPNKISNDLIAIGKFIRKKRPWQEIGSNISDFTLFEIIQQQGHDIAELVRKPIKEVFSEIVDHTTLLIPYKELKVNIDIEPKTTKDFFISYFNHSIKRNTFNIHRLGLRTNFPDKVFLNGSEDSDSINVIDLKNIPIIEDTTDDLLRLYKKAKSEVEKIKKHNDRLIEKIKEAIAPFRLAKRFK